MQQLLPGPQYIAEVRQLFYADFCSILLDAYYKTGTVTFFRAKMSDEVKEGKWTEIDREFKAVQECTVKIKGIAYGPTQLQLKDDERYNLKNGQQITGYKFQIYLEPKKS